MLTAITRAVSPALNRCELEHLERQEIDVPKAVAQHQAYEACLRSLGVNVISLAAEPDLPDSMFVEDPAVVVKEVAVMTRMGVLSRRPEVDTLSAALARYRPLHWMREPATLEGGDVLRIGKTLFVGASNRTNGEGIVQLSAALEPFGYSVRPVAVRGCLHLKSACSAIDDQTVLANLEWIPTSAFEEFEIIGVPPEEPRAGNVLAIGNSVLVPAAFPQTARLLEKWRLNVHVLDISELMKAESGLTCSSILLETE